MDDPYTIAIERAIELIEAKREKDRNKIINTFENEGVLQVLNGRWGPYISYNNENFRIPKGKDPKELTLEDCLAVIKKGSSSSKGKRKVRRGAKTTNK